MFYSTGEGDLAAVRTRPAWIPRPNSFDSRLGRFVQQSMSHLTHSNIVDFNRFISSGEGAHQQSAGHEIVAILQSLRRGRVGVGREAQQNQQHFRHLD